MKNVLKNGLLAFVGIGVYFLVAEVFKFSNSTPLRLLNFFILGYFVHKTIVNAKKTDKNFRRSIHSFSNNLDPHGFF
jgi:hypothetical protein